jgi:hypothetical protein
VDRIEQLEREVEELKRRERERQEAEARQRDIERERARYCERCGQDRVWRGSVGWGCGCGVQYPRRSGS